VKAQTLSRQYATAVLSLALEKWLTPLNAVRDRLTDSPNLAESLQDTGRSFNSRQKELDEIIPANSAQEARNFLYTLLKNGDIGLLGEVLADLERMSRGGPLVQVARVTTAIVLSDSDKEKFRQTLRAKYGDNLEFAFHVDPTIIGGAVVQVSDQVIDGSVATRLEAMGNVLGIR
jgi:F-type H+-transporting ATPase subunit delta